MPLVRPIGSRRLNTHPIRMTNDPVLALDADPFEAFAMWYAHALETDPQADAMSLATATASGVPSCRVVLLKGVEEGCFWFFTNYDSRKAVDLAENPQAALLFLWHSPKRQVRIEGSVERLSEVDSQTYFASRDRDSQLGAWVSEQSAVVTSRDVLFEGLEKIRQRFEGGTVPCPPNWGGYCLTPESFEFWQGRPARLHHRTRFTRLAESWQAVHLAP
jgi:pyridoxamine 5'-phosphate oxidase